jgi:hypothetical protein
MGRSFSVTETRRGLPTGLTPVGTLDRIGTLDDELKALEPGPGE